MDVERLKVNLEVVWLRLSGLVKTGIRACGLLIVLLGVFNGFGPLFGLEALAVYPRTTPLYVGEGGIVAFEDVAAIAIGGIITHFL